MIGFVLTAAAVFACGLGLVRRWRDDAGPAERALAAAVVGLAVWIAANWLLAVAHLFTKPALIAVAIAMVVGAVGDPRFAIRDSRFAIRGPRVLLLIPIVLWTLFALWKGFVLPPQTHDALAYHLPKAAMIAQAHGFEHFAAPDPRITSLPANYELLLADVLVMSGSDTCTEWLGTLAFLLFLTAVAAMAERWWPAHPHRAATVLAAAGAPLLLLHSTADKNDILLCALCVAAILWVARGGRVPMLLAVVSLAMAGGTKPTAAAVLIAVAPVLLLRWRTLRLGELAAASILAFLLLGGIAYIDIFGVSHGSAHGPSGLESSEKYGDWANLWRVPALALMVPFEPKPNAVWVPWRGEYWYWPHYEIFFSHYGALISILVPFAIVCALRRNEPNRERTIATTVTLAAAALILPLQMRPLGMFAAMPRYIAFVLPVIVCWGVPPMIELLRARAPILAQTFVAAILVFFAVSAIDVGVNDRMAPLRFVRWAAQHPGDRHIWFMPNRGASVADRYAGPHDTIAIDGGFDTWSYPAYGPHITRRVVFIHGDVPPDAQWVVIDHAYSRVWMNPNLTDMGKFWNFVGRGKPRPEDVRLLLQLEHDPRFVEVFYDPRINQAVFERRGQGAGGGAQVLSSRRPPSAPRALRPAPSIR